MTLTKLFYMAEIAVRRPYEVIDRLRATREVTTETEHEARSSYKIEQQDVAIKKLAAIFDASADSILNEQELINLESEINGKIREISSQNDAPFKLAHNGDVLFARICYLMCRLLKPAVVIETGVCYGVGSAFMLAALEKNGKGALYSIDLPPLGDVDGNWVGAAVPQRLRSRWKLYRGSSRRVLPKLIDELPEVNLFVHDSLHTKATMSFEFETAQRKLSFPGALISDDIDNNLAFAEFILRKTPKTSTVIQEAEKQSLLGVAVYA